jgi:hypothetical protein
MPCFKDEGGVFDASSLKMGYFKDEAMQIDYTLVQWMRMPLRSMPRNQVIWRFAN